MMRLRIGNTVIFGIDAENVRRLKDARPIAVDLAELGGGAATKVVIFYGETIDAMVAQLKREGLLPPEYEAPIVPPPPRGIQ